MFLIDIPRSEFSLLSILGGHLVITWLICRRDNLWNSICSTLHREPTALLGRLISFYTHPQYSQSFGCDRTIAMHPPRYDLDPPPAAPAPAASPPYPHARFNLAQPHGTPPQNHVAVPVHQATANLSPDRNSEA